VEKAWKTPVGQYQLAGAAAASGVTPAASSIGASGSGVIPAPVPAAASGVTPAAVDEDPNWCNLAAGAVTWMPKFEEMTPCGGLPAYSRISSPIHSWSRVITMTDSSPLYYAGSKRRTRLYDGLARVGYPMLGADEGPRWKVGDVIEAHGEDALRFGS
jgi:hypothetical protein